MHRGDSNDRRGSRIFTILAILVLVAPAALAAPDSPWSYTSKYNGKIFAHEISGDLVLVRFAEGVSLLERDRIAADRSLEAMISSENVKDLGVYRIPAGASLDAVTAALRAEAGIAGVEPLLVDQEGYPKYYVPGEFTVQFHRGVAPERCEAILREVGAEIVTRQWTPGYYTAALPAGRTLFETIGLVQERPEVWFAEGSVLGFDDALYIPNDPLYPDQWHLHNDNGNPGTPGADVHAEGAWDITLGDPDVVIAIIDTGMDLDHPDLAGNLLPRGGEDWDFSGSGTAPEDSQGHGTSCSGLAAGIGDNGAGVSGVCPQCSLMPLKIDLTSGANQNRADAINFLVSKALSLPGKRFLGSCSWRMSSGDFTAVEAAMQNAWDNGVPMLVASGNDNGPISYPAVYPTTIAVGASSPCDERKNPSSCDGESFWGSNYGPEQTVVAPGVLMTTSSMGGGYTATFNGTSSACPTAAGVVGLMLSANPTLSRADVQHFLETSADDQVGPAVEDPPGWDPWMGWGRVNAQAAVESVANFPPPTILTVVPSSGAINQAQAITIHGEDFYGQIEVTFGGVQATNVQIIDPTELQCICPFGEVLGPVDVQVANAFGSGALTQGYTYLSHWIDVTPAVIGSIVEFRADGPPLGKWGAVLDLVPGAAVKKGLTWCLAFSPARTILHNAWAGDAVLNGLGQGTTYFAVPDDPGLVGETLYTQAVFDGNGPQVGRILMLSDCLETLVLAP